MNPDTVGRSSNDILVGGLRDGHLEERWQVRRAVAALVAEKGQNPPAELAILVGAHPALIDHWNRAPLEDAPDLFERGGGRDARDRRPAG